jgi:hypothetical protein
MSCYQICLLLCCGSGMFIPGPRIPGPNFFFKEIWSGLFLSDPDPVSYPDPNFLPIPDPGVNKAPATGSGSATLVFYPCFKKNSMVLPTLKIKSWTLLDPNCNSILLSPLSLSSDRAYRPRTRRLCRPSWPREESPHPPHSCPTSTATNRIWVSSFPHPFSPFHSIKPLPDPTSCHIPLLQSTGVCCFSKLFASLWVAKSFVIMWCIFHLSSYNFLLLGLEVSKPKAVLSLFIYCPMSIPGIRHSF